MPTEARRTIDHATYEDAIRQNWRVPSHEDWPAAEGEAGDELLFGSREPIPTEPGERDETRHETEAGAGFIVALVVALLAVCAGLWANRMWWAQ